jgi:hypothetical protein
MLCSSACRRSTPPMEHPAGRRLCRHAAEQFRGVGGDAGHGPLQVAQLQRQQALAAHRQRAALPLRRFQAAVVVVDQHGANRPPAARPAARRPR